MNSPMVKRLNKSSTNTGLAATAQQDIFKYNKREDIMKVAAETTYVWALSQFFGRNAWI